MLKKTRVSGDHPCDRSGNRRNHSFSHNIQGMERCLDSYTLKVFMSVVIMYVIFN